MIDPISKGFICIQLLSSSRRLMSSGESIFYGLLNAIANESKHCSDFY